MQGVITEIDSERRRGMILAADGMRYPFGGIKILGYVPRDPVGVAVDFKMDKGRVSDVVSLRLSPARTAWSYLNPLNGFFWWGP